MMVCTLSEIPDASSEKVLTRVLEALPADTFVWAASPEATFLNGKYIFANFDVEELKARQEEIKEKKLLEMWLMGVSH